MNGRGAEFWEKSTDAGLKLLAFVLPLTFYLKTYNTDIVKEATLLAGACLVWFCAAARQFETGRVEWPANRTGLAIIAKLLVFWTAASLATSSHPELAAFPALRFTLFIVLFLIVLAGPASVSFAAGLSAATAAATGIAGAYALLQAAGGDPLPWSGAYGRQAFSTFARPEHFGTFAACAFPLALSLTVDPLGSRPARAAAYAAAFLSFTGVILSGSGCALAAFLAAGAFFAACALKRLGQEGRTAGRLAAAAVPAAALGALAFGGGAFADILALRPRFLLVPATAGRVGFLLAAGLLLAALGVSMTNFQRRSREGELRAAAIMLGQWTAAAALLLAGGLGTAAQAAAPGALLWLLAGSLAGLALERGASVVRVVPIPLPPLARRALYVPAGALAGAGFLAALGVMGWDCNHNTALYLASRGDIGGAVKRFDGVSRWHPDGVHARYLAANLVAGQGRHEEALTRYARVERLARHYRRLDFRMAAAYAKLHRWEEAEESLLAYHRVRTDDPESYRLLVDVSQDLGKKERAHQAALELVRIEPDEPKHWYLRAELYKQDGEYAKARKMLDRAAKVRDYAGSPPPPDSL